MKTREMRGNILLLITAMIWGCAFVAQSVAADYVGAFTFLAARSLLGGLVLLPFILGRTLRRKREGTYRKPTAKETKTLWIGGLLCGTSLCIASALQQIGIAYTTVGNAGFITAMYIVIVPIFGLFLGKKAGGRLGISVAVAVVALYLLSIGEGFSVSRGDLLMMLCAVMFAVQILLVDRYSPQVDGVQLACIQFFVGAVLSGVMMLIFEKPTVAAVSAAWLPIAYAGLLSSGVAYTFQILAQKYTRPPVASLRKRLESVFAVLAAAVVLHQIPTLREGIGCLLMFAAIILVQLPDRRSRHA